MNVKIYVLIENQYEGGNNMAVLTQNNLKGFIISSSKAKDFINESNKNKITPSFLEKCNKASNLFKRGISK